MGYRDRSSAWAAVDRGLNCRTAEANAPFENWSPPASTLLRSIWDQAMTGDPAAVAAVVLILETRSRPLESWARSRSIRSSHVERARIVPRWPTGWAPRGRPVRSGCDRFLVQS